MLKLLLENNLTEELLLHINNSHKNIFALVYYFQTHSSHRNDHATKVLNSLILAKKRGLDVKLLFNNQMTRHKTTLVNKRIAQQLTAAGVDAKTSKLGRLTHAKAWMFDNSGVIIGSHNITLRSMRISREVSIYVEDKNINQELTKYFLEQFYNAGG